MQAFLSKNTDEVIFNFSILECLGFVFWYFCDHKLSTEVYFFRTYLKNVAKGSGQGAIIGLPVCPLAV
jgi:hypothetical protein